MPNEDHNPNSIAIKVLEERKIKLREEYERDLRELNETIERLRSDSARRVPGRWEGMSIPDSIHAFLLEHRGPVKCQRIVEALVVGGVRLGDPEKPKRYVANVKTTIINNRRRFRYDKRKDTVQLLRPIEAEAETH